MEQKSVRKRKYHSMALDPNYHQDCTTSRTQKLWEEKYKQSLHKSEEKLLEKTSKSLGGELDCSTSFEPNLQAIPTLLVSTDEDEIEQSYNYYDDSSDDNDNDFSSSMNPNLSSSTSSSTNQESTSSAPFTDDNTASWLEGCHRIMFEKSGQTINDVIEMVVAYSLKFGISNEARTTLIEMLKLCAGPDFKNINISNYKMSQAFNPPPDKITFHFYCDKCFSTILHSSPKNGVNGQSITCKACEAEHIIKLTSNNNFLTIDLKYQLQQMLRKEELFKYFTDENENSIENSVITDIKDSKLYKKSIKKFSTPITYNISTDGAPLFHVSKNGFWPLQVCFNNLPINVRFKYVLLAGIMVVLKEPNPSLMYLYMKEFLKQVNRLQFEGVKTTCPDQGTEETLYFTLLAVIADSVARALLQYRLQYNGFYGCSYCYHGGHHIKKKGMKYPFLKEEPELRTHESHQMDVKNTEIHGSFVRGVKGESAFMSYPNLDMVWGFPLDYLHNALLGVTEQVWSSFFNLLKPNERTEIDNLLLSIQPPRDLYRATEKLSNKSIWKATHWRAWLLFYSLPICSKFSALNHLIDNYALFVNSIFTLLKREITKDELNTCEQNLLIFVSQYESLYGTDRMTFNVHIVLHIAESVRQSGPLLATSTFPFEHAIHNYKQTLNGPKSPEQQIAVKSLNLLKYKVRPYNSIISDQARDFCDAIFTSKVATKSAVKVGNLTLFGPHPKNVFTFVTNKRFERCIFENIVYSSTRYTRSKKLDDTVIMLKSREFVQITDIQILPNNSCVFIVKQLIVEPFIAGNTRVSHIWKIIKNIDHSPVSLFEIDSKAVVLDFTTEQYICELPNTFEAQ